MLSLLRDCYFVHSFSNIACGYISQQVRNQSSTFLTEDGDMSQYTTPQMYSDNAINPCLESTYNFISIVMDEVKHV